MSVSAVTPDEIAGYSIWALPERKAVATGTTIIDARATSEIT
jgi:hypothetical protein